MGSLPGASSRWWAGCGPVRAGFDDRRAGYLHRARYPSGPTAGHRARSDRLLAGPRLTALAGVLAVAAQVLTAVFLGGLTTPDHLAQIIALTTLSALVIFMRCVRERRDRALSRARSVAETAQRVLLRPPPRRIGPLQVAWLYMSAEDETEIGVICLRSPAPRMPRPGWSSAMSGATGWPPSVRPRWCWGHSVRALTGMPPSPGW